MNKNISKPNIGENLSPHKHQSSVVNISKPIENYNLEVIVIPEMMAEIIEYCFEWGDPKGMAITNRISEIALNYFEKVEQQAILNERTKTLEMLKDEPIEKVKILHESARRGYYIRTKDAGAYARNKFRRNLRDKIKEN